jgi:hypothetical protein
MACSAARNASLGGSGAEAHAMSRNTAAVANGILFHMLISPGSWTDAFDDTDRRSLVGFLTTWILRQRQAFVCTPPHQASGAQRLVCGTVQTNTGTATIIAF